MGAIELQIAFDNFLCQTIPVTERKKDQYGKLTETALNSRDNAILSKLKDFDSSTYSFYQANQPVKIQITFLRQLGPLRTLCHTGLGMLDWMKQPRVLVFHRPLPLQMNSALHAAVCARPYRPITQMLSGCGE